MNTIHFIIRDDFVLIFNNLSYENHFIREFVQKFSTHQIFSNFLCGQMIYLLQK